MLYAKIDQRCIHLLFRMSYFKSINLHFNLCSILVFDYILSLIVVYQISRTCSLIFFCSSVLFILSPYDYVFYIIILHNHTTFFSTIFNKAEVILTIPAGLPTTSTNTPKT